MHPYRLPTKDPMHSRYTVLAALLLGATLALGAVAAAGALAKAVARLKTEELVRVKGTAEQAVVSDRATWTCDLVVRGAELAAANSMLVQQRAMVSTFLAARGATAPELTLAAVVVEPLRAQDEKGNKTNRIELYELRQRFALVTAQVALADTISTAISDLLALGVEIRSYAPQYTVSDLERVKLALLEQATANARQRAELLARGGGGGGRLGPLISASQGVFQIVPPSSTDTSDYGSYDTATIPKVVKAVVTLEFASRP